MDKDFKIAQTIKEAYLACEPFPLPEGDPRYVDFSPVRGENIQEQIKRHLDFRSQDRTFRLAIASHRGIGKTTELLRFKESIQDKYSVIYFEANVDLDPYNIEYSDLMMYLAYAIEKQMREQGMPIDKKILNEVAKWFSVITKEEEKSVEYSLGVGAEAKAKAELPFFAKLMGYLSSSIKSESTSREKIRREVKKYPKTLIENLNYLLDDAALKLAKNGRKLLIIIDNLDRYKDEVIDTLLIQNKELLAGIRWNVIFTPPISLIYVPITDSLTTVMDYVSLPAVKLKEKDTTPNQQGIDLMLDAINQRINTSRIFQDEEDLKKMIRISGGCIRDLLRLIQYSCIETAGETIASQTVERAIRRLRNEFKNQIPKEYYPELAKIGIDKDTEATDTHRVILYRRYALKYNGHEEWADVHPIILEIEAYKQALLKEKEEKREKDVK